MPQRPLRREFGDTRRTRRAITRTSVGATVTSIASGGGNRNASWERNVVDEAGEFSEISRRATSKCRDVPESIEVGRGHGSIQASSKFVERDTEPIQDDDGKVAVLIENRGEHVAIAGRSRVIENGRQAPGDARVPLRR